MDPLTDSDAASAADTLRRVVDLARTGEIEAAPNAVAYLSGVADGLDARARD